MQNKKPSVGGVWIFSVTAIENFGRLVGITKYATVPCKCKLTVPRNSNFETRSSILETRKLRGSRLESSASSIESSASSFEAGNKELFA